MTDNMPDNYTIIDIETTGLSPEYDDIIELSALKIRNNSIIDEFSTLVKPNKELNSFITNLTGITSSMLEDVPSISDVLPKFIEFLSDDIILGHNVNFDIRFIQNKLKRQMNSTIHNQSIDTMKIAKRKLKLQSYKLSHIAQKYDINTDNNHRGLKDCYITYEVYNNLTGKTEPKFVQQSLL